MTALTADSLPTTARPLGRRISTIMLLQLTNPMTLIGWPLMILGFIYVLNLAIYSLISTATEGATAVGVNGGVGFGATRRDYLLGTGALFTLLSAGYAALIATLAMAERAVDYWGIGLRFFDTSPDFSWFELFLGTFLLLLLFASVGGATAAVYVRWKASGMYVFWAGLVVLLVAVGFLLTWTESWGAVGEFFATAGVLGTLAWSLVISAIAAIAAYLILRKATPTNT